MTAAMTTSKYLFVTRPWINIRKGLYAMKYGGSRASALMIVSLDEETSHCEDDQDDCIFPHQDGNVNGDDDNKEMTKEL